MNGLTKSITLALLCSLWLYGTGFTLMGMGKKASSPTANDMMYDFILREGKSLGKKHKMSLVATGGGTMGGIGLMNLSFYRYGSPLDEEESRELIIKCLHELLEAANGDEKLRPFLRNYPLTPENIDVAIYDYHPKTEFIYVYPYISVFAASRGRITYFSIDAEDRFKYKSEKYETYEEAIAILQKEQDEPQKKGPLEIKVL